jgi:GGDEF domain-containing protein
MPEDLAQVLKVMAADSVRVETGLGWLKRWLAGHPAEAGLMLLDLDGSAAVRAHGLPAKQHLVSQVQQVVNRSAPGDALVIDSGSRDEMLIALPQAGWGRLQASAEAVRHRIRREPFRVCGLRDPVWISASLGIARVPAGASAERGLELAREGLTLAKRQRDCVCRAPEAADAEVMVSAPWGALQVLDAHGVDLADAVRQGVRYLREKYEPMWYWLCGVPGQLPSPAAVGRRIGDTPAEQFFWILVAQVLAESQGRETEVTGAALAVGGAIQEKVTLAPGTVQAIDRICLRRKRAKADLLAQAVRLTAIRLHLDRPRQAVGGGEFA